MRKYLFSHEFWSSLRNRFALTCENPKRILYVVVAAVTPKAIEELVKAQNRSTKLIKGLEHPSAEKRLKRLRFFSFKKDN